jgi:hypothetical protein
MARTTYALKTGETGKGADDFGGWSVGCEAGQWKTRLSACFSRKVPVKTVNFGFPQALAQYVAGGVQSIARSSKGL